MSFSRIKATPGVLEYAAADHVSVMAEALPCQSDHPFLIAYGLEGAPCSVFPGFAEINDVTYHGTIVAPLHSVDVKRCDAVLITLDPNGQALQVCANGLQRGAFAKIGDGDLPILIVEDWASGMSLHLATGYRVAVACEVANLAEVCVALAAEFPDTVRILCVNSAMSAKVMAMLSEMAEAHGTLIASPLDRDNESADTTFNGLHRSQGLDAVARRIHLACGAESQGRDAIAQPWPYPVDGRFLLNSLVKSILRHTVLNRPMAIAIALWVVFTHTISAARIAPLLLISSPVKRCGKTTLGQLLGFLTCRPISTSNITAAALYNEIGGSPPTMIIDEADTFLPRSPDLNGIVNSGHTRSAAYVLRNIGGQNRRYSTWCPKAILMIGLPSETIVDRSIVIPLKRKRADQVVDRLDASRPRELTILQSQIAKWADDNLRRIENTTFDRPKLGSDRAADNWEPLLAIASCVGEEWFGAALDAATELSVPQDECRSVEEMLLADVKNAFEANGVTRISSADLSRALCSDSDRPWATLEHGRAISARGLVTRLSKFGVRTKNIRKGTMVLKGYTIDQFEDAFARYVPTATMPL